MDVVAIFSFKSHESILTSFFIYQHVVLDIENEKEHQKSREYSGSFW